MAPLIGLQGISTALGHPKLLGKNGLQPIDPEPPPRSDREVKNLASQTAQATEEIERKLAAIQSATDGPPPASEQLRPQSAVLVDQIRRG